MSSAAGNEGNDTSATFGGVAPAEIREQLDRILLSQGFRNSERLQRFLRFAIGSTLGGAAEQLKNQCSAAKYSIAALVTTLGQTPSFEWSHNG
jgi:hypothetical protein